MIRGNVTLNNPSLYEMDYEISNEKLCMAIDHALTKLSSKISKFGSMFPVGRLDQPYGKVYKMGGNEHWTCGLHTGCFLLAYELSGEKKFLEVAQSHMASYKKRIDEKLHLSDHDVGFIFSPSCVAYHKVTGDETAKKIALDAAEHLYNFSYSQKGGFVIRLAALKDVFAACRTMMDTMMNIPLFYWAYEQTEDKKFLDAANSQVSITEKYLIRPDGSSYHHYQFDMETHKPLYGVTYQGHRDESTWSRGHAWGVLGLPVAYGYSHNKELLPLHRDVAYYMLNHLPDDNVPYWDFDFMSGDEPRDSSAGVICACGLLEAVGYLPDNAPEKSIYKNAAARILEATIDNCTGNIETDYDGVIYKTAGAVPQNSTLEGCAPYGDFFYLEALLRTVKPEWKCYW